jgi:outer membrane protein assembly factor BamE (lipoprotein component of BamABCDE complex)
MISRFRTSLSCTILILLAACGEQKPATTAVAKAEAPVVYDKSTTIDTLAPIRNGMSADSVVHILGKPDDTSSSYPGRETWYYGRGAQKNRTYFVCFEEGRVILSSWQHKIYRIDSPDNGKIYGEASDTAPTEDTLKSSQFSFHVKSNYNIRIHYQQDKGDIYAYTDTCNAIMEILVFDTASKLIQTIAPGENCMDGRADELLEIEDMNFDGIEDFGIAEFLPAGPNIPHYYWLYDSRQHRFVKNEELDKITSAEFRPETKTIYTWWRDGAATYGWSHYAWENDKLVVIADTLQEYKDDFVYYTVKKRVNGKLKVVKQYKEKPEEY